MKRHFLRVGTMLLAASLSLTSCQGFWDDLLGTEDNPSTPEAPAEEPEAEHEYVDLGLPSGLKWATCNIGAESPLENGNLYAWGETETKSEYSVSNYKFADGLFAYTKYGTIDGKYRLDSEDDVAQVLWGSEWRMPTYKELQELEENCTFTWVEENGKLVVKATGPNGNFIYFPLPKQYNNSSYGGYWSSDLLDNNHTVHCLDFTETSQLLREEKRYGEQSVRPVYAEVTQEPDPLEVIYEMAAGTENGKSWTWNTEAADGMVWGNMGYSGGSGEDFALNGRGSKWWGVTSEEDFSGQLAHTATGKLMGDESMDAYFILKPNGSISRHKADGTIINSGTYEIEKIVDNEWKVANLHTTAGTILWPYEINTGGYMPTTFEVLYLTKERMTLVVSERNGNAGELGSWGEGTFWEFKAK